MNKQPEDDYYGYGTGHTLLNDTVTAPDIQPRRFFGVIFKFIGTVLLLSALLALYFTARLYLTPSTPTASHTNALTTPNHHHRYRKEKH